MLLFLVCLFFTNSLFAEQPEFDDDYQLTLPRPPACPKGFQTEEEKNAADEDAEAELYDSINPKICDRVEQEPGWSSAFTYEFDDSKSESPNSVDFEKVAIAVLGVVIICLIAFLVIVLLRWTQKEQKVMSRNETENIIEHLEKLTKNQHHEKLAELGDFDIAVHALLLGVLRAIFKADPELNRPSITAREIGSTYQAPEISGDLKPLIQVVEWSLFAKRPASEENYLDLKPRAERLVALFNERAWLSKQVQEEL